MLCKLVETRRPLANFTFNLYIYPDPQKQFSILYPRNCNLHIFNLSKLQIFISAQKICFQFFYSLIMLIFGSFANQSYLYFGTFANAIYETDWFVYHLKKSLKKSFAMTTNIECSFIAPRAE